MFNYNELENERINLLFDANDDRHGVRHDSDNGDGNNEDFTDVLKRYPIFLLFALFFFISGILLIVMGRSEGMRFLGLISFLLLIPISVAAQFIFNKIVNKLKSLFKKNKRSF